MYKEKISTLLIGFSFVVTLLLVTIDYHLHTFYCEYNRNRRYNYNKYIRWGNEYSL